jgi:glutaredoxin 2
MVERRGQGRRLLDKIRTIDEEKAMPAGGHVEQEILDWIESATEPKDKAFLMILYRMNASLQENTKFTREIAEDFTKHKEAFTTHSTSITRLINMARGGYFVAIVLVVVIQALSGYIVAQQIKAADKEGEVNAMQEHRILVLETVLAEHLKTTAQMRLNEAIEGKK